MMTSSLLVFVFLFGLKIFSAEISFPSVTEFHHLSISTFDNYGTAVAAADAKSDSVQQSQAPTPQMKVLIAFFFETEVLTSIDIHSWSFGK